MLTSTLFDAHLAASGIWPQSGKVVVGYSGGADSTCLVHLLAELNCDIVAAHLHHGMRAEADRELELCAAFCESLGVPFVSGRADVPALAAERRVGLEEAGRIARYTFLQQIGRQFGAARIATAHTRTDHVETVLLHVVRGTGRRGLGGIAAVSGDLIRPMLPFDRDEARGYCAHHGLWFHDDPANEDLRFARSKLRNRVLPVLKQVNPAVEEAIARLAEVMREEDTFLDGAAAATLEQLELPLNGRLGFLTRDFEVAIELNHIRHFPVTLVRRGVRLCFETLGADLDHRQTSAIVDGLLSGVKGSVTADGGLVSAEWDHQRLRIAREEAPLEFDEPLDIPGRVDAPYLGWVLSAAEGVFEEAPVDRAAFRVDVRSASFAGPLRVRPFASGDRLQPLGFDRGRRLADILSEAHLTPAARRRVPVVCDSDGPIWVPGVTLAERARPTVGEAATRLEFSPTESER